jgi:hypothetical protein
LSPSPERPPGTPLGARAIAAWIRRPAPWRSLIDAAVGLAIGLVTWPIASMAPDVGIDASWVTGLHVAARERLAFGDEIVFTFGPLGFLGFPEPYLGWTSAAGLAFVGLVHVGATAGMFHLARHALGGAPAALLVLATAFTFPWIAGWTLFGVLIFLTTAVAVIRSSATPTGTWFAAILGSAVGIACLGKLNIGIASLVIAGIGVTVSARDRRGSIVAFVASALATFAVLWIAAGQGIVGLPTYVRSVFEFAVGYGQSMGQIDPQELLGVSIGAAATVTVAGLVLLRSADLPRKVQLALWLIFVLMAFSSFKGGYTRQGIGMLVYVVTLMALWPALVPRGAAVASAATSVAILLALVVGLSSVSIVTLIDPGGRWGALTRQAGRVLFERSEVAVMNARALQAEYGLPPEALALLSGEAVDIQPWEAALAYAYPEIEWRPQPVFQAYAALTPYLDQLNAQALASDEAPSRILWLTDPAVPLSIDGRSVWFDSPTARIEMLCRYLPIVVAPTWQVLGRGPDRCGEPVVVGSSTRGAGDRVAVPTDGPAGILTVRISGMGRDLVSQLVTLAYRAPPWWMTTPTGADRIPLGVNGEPIVIGATTDIGYRGALELEEPPRSLTVAPDEDAPGLRSPLELVFEVIPIQATP